MENLSSFWKGVIILIVLLCVLYFYTRKKQTKNDLANYYNVSKPTLQRWVTFLPSPFSLEDWKKKRQLTVFEVAKIKQQWGYDPDMVLNKNQIADRACSNYKTVAECVKMNLKKIGLTIEAWDSCSVFPPVISIRILEILG